ARKPDAAHDDATPGRASRSAELSAPETPIASGIVLRRSDVENGVQPGADRAIDRAAGSSGAPLPDAVRGRFESSLGADPSAVRVHTGAASADAATAVGARAYTIGQDIHFNAGQYDPGSRAGQHLLAHEVAHTVQQAGSAPSRQYKLEVSQPGD